MTDIFDQASDREMQERDAIIARHRHRQQQAAAQVHGPTCRDCGDELPEARRGIYPRCVHCQTVREQEQRGLAGRW